LPDDRLIGDVVFYRRVQGARRRWMGSLIEELKRREAAARAEADRLRSRAGELGQDLARAEEQASRLSIAREEVMRVLEEPPGTELPSGQPDVPAKERRPGSPIGIVTVPAWQEGTDASVLPQSYQDLLEVAADAGRPLRAAEIAAAAGLGAGRAQVESLRSKLKRLAGRGWLAEEPGAGSACRNTKGKHRNPDGNGFFFLGSEVQPIRTLMEEEPSWKRMPRFPLMIRSPPRKACSPRWPPSLPAPPRPG
jgi:hypothetical protein